VFRIRSRELRRRSARPGFRRRSRLVSSTACSVFALALALAGCGGGDEARPTLPPDVGAALEAQATDVEEALAAGDATQARAEADELVAAVRDAIDRGDVPATLRGELLDATERLASLVPEPEPPASPPPPPADEDEGEDEEKEDDEDEDDGDEKEENGKGKGRGKGKG
jgi:hypothetical protein